MAASSDGSEILLRKATEEGTAICLNSALLCGVVHSGLCGTDIDARFFNSNIMNIEREGFAV